MSTKNKPSPDNEALVDNYPVLKAWLTKVGARYQWSSPCSDAAGPLAATIYHYTIKGAGPFIVLVHPDKHGWNVYTACSSNKVDETFADAEYRLGLPKTTTWCPGCEWEPPPQGVGPKKPIRPPHTCGKVEQPPETPAAGSKTLIDKYDELAAAHVSAIRQHEAHAAGLRQRISMARKNLRAFEASSGTDREALTLAIQALRDPLPLLTLTEEETEAFEHLVTNVMLPAPEHEIPAYLHQHLDALHDKGLLRYRQRDGWSLTSAGEATYAELTR